MTTPKKSHTGIIYSANPNSPSKTHYLNIKNPELHSQDYYNPQGNQYPNADYRNTFLGHLHQSNNLTLTPSVKEQQSEDKKAFRPLDDPTHLNKANIKRNLD